MKKIPFELTDWDKIPEAKHSGENGIAVWRTMQLGDLRIRMVEYSENYKADHWCEMGHVVYCVEGEMTTEMLDGKKFILSKGMSFTVSDGLSTHRICSLKGAKVFIVDGKFLDCPEN